MGLKNEIRRVLVGFVLTFGAQAHALDLRIKLLGTDGIQIFNN